VSNEPRDREALDLIAQRSFDSCAVFDVQLEMLARRLQLRLYGALRPGDAATYLAALTFFNIRGLEIENPAGNFPESVRLVGLHTTYSESDDVGSLEVQGGSDWQLRCTFDGVAYEEHPATLASLRDDL